MRRRGARLGALAEFETWDRVFPLRVSLLIRGGKRSMGNAGPDQLGPGQNIRRSRFAQEIGPEPKSAG
jgi:hypothetical protein